MGIHHYKRVIAIRVSLILVKCNSRDSRIIHLTWAFRKVSLCAFLFLLLIPGTCWEFTYGELIWLKWCTIQAQWRNSTGWLSLSNISPPMLKGEVVHPYITLVHTFLLTLHELWCLSGASKNGYKPLIQLQIISQRETDFSARIGAKLTQ